MPPHSEFVRKTNAKGPGRVVVAVIVADDGKTPVSHRFVLQVVGIGVRTPMTGCVRVFQVKTALGISAHAVYWKIEFPEIAYGLPVDRCHWSQSAAIRENKVVRVLQPRREFRRV